MKLFIKMKLFLVAAMCAAAAAKLDVSGAGEPCMWSSYNNDTAKTSVQCRVRALALDSPNFSSVQPEGTVRLTVDCTDKLFLQSTLVPRMFRPLHQLEELALVRCKLLVIPTDAFDGLGGLKKLTVHTSNLEWGATKTMELAQGSLDRLTELQSLDLSESNVHTVPADAFCALKNIQQLNVSHNGIEDLTTLGFSGPDCPGGTDLKVLNLSWNNLQSVPARTAISAMKRLQTLTLQHNSITDIAADSLSTLTSLKVFNASYNKLEALPETLFAKNRDLREVYLQNNGLYELPRGLFHRLEQMVIINLSNNKINQIDEGPFVGLLRLVVLDLSRNGLTRIKSNVFKDLVFLQILDLSNNSISSIEENAFFPLYNLHTLNLAENRLHTVGPRLFNGLYVLSKLTINNNLLITIDDQAFKNCSALKELDLSSNAIQQVPAALNELSFLKTLDLGENQISVFHNNSFKNMELLTGLRLVDNFIGNLTIGMFSNLPNLQVLNLSKNKIYTIERGTFTQNSQIQAIRLDANYLTDVNGVFESLSSLQWINLSKNNLIWFDYAMVPANLKWLDLHDNYVQELGDYYNLKDRLNINTIDASHNHITEISERSIPNSIEVLFLNNNFLSNIRPNTFLKKRNLVRVDLYANELTRLDVNALRLGVVPINRSLPEFYIGGNPFECDCSMDWLPAVNNMTQLRQNPKVMDLDNVVCKTTDSRGSEVVPILSAGPSQFLCKYETHCFTVCKCCEYDACDCEMTCPNNCTCYHDQTWHTNIVDCSYQLNNQVPPKLPMDATHVYLDGNNFNQLQGHIFIGRKNMVHLYLNNSKIESLQNHTFNRLSSLQVLHLEDNMLTELKGYEFEQLYQLRQLHLHNNRLSYVNNMTFAPLRNLEVLRLHGNLLSNFNVWQLSVNPYLVQLSVGKNPWSCRCKFLQPFRNWVYENGPKISDMSDVTCVPDESDPGQRREIDFNETACSDFYTGGWALRNMMTSSYVPLLTFLLVVFVVALVLFAVRDNIKVWLYTKYGIRVFSCKNSSNKHFYEDREKLYDGYVLYSPKDEEFVLQSVVAELEHGNPSYQLCLHYRDLPITSMYHAGSSPVVIEAAEASRRVIVVLSRNFIQTEWSRYEFRSALHEALKGKVYKLVLIEENSIAAEADADPEIRPYLKVASKVRWGEKRFWERLRYLMPSNNHHNNNHHHHKVCNYRNNINNYTIDTRTPVVPAHRRQPPPSPQDKGTHHRPHGHHHHHHQHHQQQQHSPGSLPRPQHRHEDSNYSTATTVTPSPKLGGGCEDRPASTEHIYSAIDTPPPSVHQSPSRMMPPVHQFERTNSRRSAKHHQHQNAVQAYLV
uniref:Protein toll n=1 Tax=Schizaphis graminum TaxID=13262 RepID=A0A2S2NF12_SCHGA